MMLGAGIRGRKQRLTAESRIEEAGSVRGEIVETIDGHYLVTFDLQC